MVASFFGGISFHSVSRFHSYTQKNTFNNYGLTALSKGKGTGVAICVAVFF